MNKIHADLFAVISRFPDRRNALLAMFLKSKDFRDMCEDYRKCQDALTFWAQSDKKNAAVPREEYKSLMNELASEIIQKLDENT